MVSQDQPTNNGARKNSPFKEPIRGYYRNPCVKRLSQKQEHDIIDLCSSSSDDENPPVQFLSMSSDDVKHEEIEYYGVNLALPIFKSGLKGNSLSAVDIT
ncbi:hypothetical protein ACROYT_G021768 [Oculina patagonica]